MARLLCTLRAELDLVHDALAEIERIMRALATRHGSKYRELERRIESLAKSPPTAEAWGDAKTHMLAEGIILFEPWPIHQDIIRDARAMGL